MQAYCSTEDRPSNMSSPRPPGELFGQPVSELKRGVPAAENAGYLGRRMLKTLPAGAIRCLQTRPRSPGGSVATCISH